MGYVKFLLGLLTGRDVFDGALKIHGIALCIFYGPGIDGNPAGAFVLSIDLGLEFLHNTALSYDLLQSDPVRGIDIYLSTDVRDRFDHLLW
ncbi:MAG: hypothetical protein A4E62_00935 [Syntrophorhabdus sp. PtaU1.Bin002]|nr:MAG: hypothetical protein A4E62_00935 [Syntrophorhabdus sp. PtaU1.Bin002]